MATETGIQRIVRSYFHRLARSIDVHRAILNASWATGTYLEDREVDMTVVTDDFAGMRLLRGLKYLEREMEE